MSALTLFETNVKNQTNSETKKRPLVFGKDEVLANAMEYFHGDELAATTWMNKYALRNVTGDLVESSPIDMHRRMAKEFARIEAKYPKVEPIQRAQLSAYGQKRKPMAEEHIFQLFDGFRDVVPQGSVMASLGDPYRLASLSNCVVLPSPQDSYGGIFRNDQQLAQLFKRRCGVGFDLSTLRPAGAAVSNAARTSTGAVSFMERFSNTTREVAQKGRRGALMLTMDIAHPDVEEFITMKQDLQKVTGANVSVRVSDAFLKAVEEDTEFTQQWPVDSKDPKITKTIKARELWNTLVTCAHNTAEPGIIFWDRQHHYSTSSVYPDFRNASTNPCSEIAMQGGDSCRLIAINMHSFVKDPFTSNPWFDHDRFAEVSYEAQRLMDDLVDLELEAVDRILAKIDSDPEPDDVKLVERSTWQLLRDTGKKGRRTGLGFTGLADAIAALGLKYDSDGAREAVEDIMKTKCRAEFDSSIDMAIERGAFQAFDPAVERTSEFVQMLSEELPEVHDRMMKYGRRNISLSTVAPTGSLSLLTRTSSGIEPVYMLSYTRRRKIMGNDPSVEANFTDAQGDQWEEFTVHHPRLLEWMKVTGKTNTSESPYQGSTANDIDHKRRVRMQAVVQKYTTHSISSTINLPSTATVEEVGNIYLDAWQNGLKGITVYRDGSRSGVLVATTEKKDETNAHHGKRPERLEADILRFNNETEPWLAVVGKLDGRPYEIFTGKAEGVFELPRWVKNGWVVKRRDPNNKKNVYDLEYADAEGFRASVQGLSRSFEKEYWNYAILISGMMRQGMPLPQVVDVVTNLNLYDATLNTWKNGVARALQRYIADGTQATGRQCVDCGDKDGLYYEEGCLKCKSCGGSKCG
ncbi:MAG: adenosylcobalamin-dependent ribonucleoside-diphosphate reductase [Flavobacteriales bacterium]|nr:adenosylcobalamin-dependent ribonucleoside-diphosphate reductase [Flavobacteriales bacterium]MBK6943203.1 adenosylcobalamin-dependent ribonucleoside-diphosphate reductase [Flavobacteriales bacterium]MBK7240914.1 adenosylcobalamin-dependent ribonucleoside-diphosphate reductase [Flavobacteriales bacterium]MBP9137929.1 adenosylcobalamin-dependent ribonucleoside-diphosphate reductase [Flavobacteriales bacterium]HQV51918.1 adenosylcobalamin-dependent ribonucleoside-diphosphate reductase [Flavobac